MKILFLLLVPLGYLFAMRRWWFATKYWQERKKKHDRWGLEDISGGVAG